MDNKKLGLGLMAVAGAFFLVGIITMIADVSTRWTEPFQQLGWIFFVAGFLVLYLLTGREIIRPQLARIAWIAGGISMALFLLALILNAASSSFESWYEAVEAAASIAMLVTVMTSIWSVGGMKEESA